jgi:hypothetical protein
MFSSSALTLALLTGESTDDLESGTVIVFAGLFLVVGVVSLMHIPTFWKKRRAHAQNVFSARWREQQEEDGHYETLHGGVST